MANGSGSTAITSTNPQSWGQQQYTVNKPLRKAKETVYANITWQRVVIFGVWTSVAVVLIFPWIIVNLPIVKYAVVALEFIWVYIYIRFLMTCESYDETFLTLRYMIAEYKGKHEICKFEMDVDMLQTYIPVKKVHPRGLIEYTRGRFAVLIRYTPPEDPGEEMVSHLIDIQAVINRLAGDMMVTFISSSRFGTRSPLIKKFERMIRDVSTPLKNIKLINSIRNKILNGKTTPDWAFYIVLGLGAHATVEEAYDKIDSELPGFLDGLDHAHIKADVIVSETEIVKNLIQFMVPRDL